MAEEACVDKEHFDRVLDSCQLLLLLLLLLFVVFELRNYFELVPEVFDGGRFRGFVDIDEVGRGRQNDVMGRIEGGGHPGEAEATAQAVHGVVCDVCFALERKKNSRS